MQRRTSTRESVLLWPPALPLEVSVDEFIILLLLHLLLILGPLYDTLSNHRKLKRTFINSSGKQAQRLRHNKDPLMVDKIIGQFLIQKEEGGPLFVFFKYPERSSLN